MNDHQNENPDSHDDLIAAARSQAAAQRGGHRAIAGDSAGCDLDATARSPAGEQPGDIIGPYKLLQRIGKGGFGEVYMAEQQAPIRRKVALKVIKLGMDTREVIARFEAERQALAMMDHPNIAKVLDAGATERGRPFFVMELVRGVPITQFCDENRLNVRQRLGLFRDVCHAVQHAHQKGIIHRDIKPTNVMVTMHDDKPVPKVIDFGIAKATQQELTEKTLFTQYGQFIGTPAYVSPEQAQHSGLDIDTRSDIYSLGVLLYELLTGSTPLDTTKLISAGFDEMRRIIREVEPPSPSARLSSLGETAMRTAQQRHLADPKALGTIMRGDLDWIVMKALEKDRTRRYETANGLAADIKRHLNNEPVAAGPPSARYRLRKFVRRNRWQVIAAGVLVAALVLGIAGTTGGMVWALQQKERAQTAEVATQRELNRATEVKRLITEMLGSVTPEKAKGADITLLKGILDDTAARLERGEVKDELIAVELHDVIGNVYWNLGLLEAAERHLPIAVDIHTRAQGAEHPNTLLAMNSLAALYLKQGRYPMAEPLFLKTLEIQKRVLGEEHPDTLASMGNLAVLYWKQYRYLEAEPLYLRTLEIQKRVLGEESPDALNSMNNLALLFWNQGRYAEAEQMNLKTLETQKRVLGEESQAALNSMNNLALVYDEQGRHAEAEHLFLKAIEIKNRVLGEAHPDTLKSVNSLANTYMNQSRYTEAAALYIKTLESRKRVLGDEHPDTLQSLHNLALVYTNEGRYGEAEPLYLRALEARKRLLGPEHRETLSTITNLGKLYNAMGRNEDARKIFESSLPVERRVLGMQHSLTREAMTGLAKSYVELGRRADALPLYRELLEYQLALADEREADANTLVETAAALLTHDFEELRDPARALRLAERACAKEEAAGGGVLWEYLGALALAQHRTGDTAKAIETQKRAISLSPESTSEADRTDMENNVRAYESALLKQRKLAGNGVFR